MIHSPKVTSQIKNKIDNAEAVKQSMDGCLKICKNEAAPAWYKKPNKSEQK